MKVSKPGGLICHWDYCDIFTIMVYLVFSMNFSLIVLQVFLYELLVHLYVFPEPHILNQVL